MCLYISITDCGSCCWAKAAQQWHLRAAGNCCCHLAATECGHSQGSFGGMSHVQFPVWWFQIPIQSENMSCSLPVQPGHATLTRGDEPDKKISFYTTQLFAEQHNCCSSSGFAESGLKGGCKAMNSLGPGHATSRASCRPCTPSVHSTRIGQWRVSFPKRFTFAQLLNSQAGFTGVCTE